ncbi:TPA: YopX family protein [Bacillus cereus]|uniref:YopX family protein n=1 Tax=Bacillus cereus group TaxID=86661 RepID=UPI0019252E08|nr:YopX family protein [Bacillus cereus]MBL3881189.1 hypothetical protein [Bacillus cereus]HDR7981166.1 hypothetical protein [Bacillus cereus]HDR8058221.1 hypothetical protein [Bacillus cereus]HDR8074201.1 hypothetical protein [Bacillus cereus]HDR8219636.1 hypothetical protein [Bacillus cereus]
MREIKFDAIYKPTGEHFTPKNINFENNTTHGNFDGEVNDWCHFSLDGSYGDAILRQYTGLKDKNGKEIYEGDIVKFLYKKDVYSIGLIYWNDSFASWYIACFHFASYKSLGQFKSVSEVIGNLYNKPELLEN